MEDTGLGKVRDLIPSPMNIRIELRIYSVDASSRVYV
jgi:hypothetical protein